MCGIAGAGKTAFSQKLEQHGFERLAIDEEVWSTFGRYGIDYPVEKYGDYLKEAHKILKTKIAALVRAQKRVVVDSSFWNRAERDDYKRVIENAGGKWRLIFLKVRPEELRRRLKIRSRRFDANAAFAITEELLTKFLDGFEEPNGKGKSSSSTMERLPIFRRNIYQRFSTENSQETKLP